MNLPEQPPMFRPPTAAERPWWWRLEDSSGAEVALPGEVEEEYGDRRFSSQADAETWIGETWRELLAAGVHQVTLLEDDHVVYGPMGLSSPV